MAKVFFSAKEMFYKNLEDVEKRSAAPFKDLAIYGTINYCVYIVSQGKGIRPVCSENGLIEEGKEYESATGEYSSLLGRDYILKGRFELDSFKKATKDDLFLFMYLASPKYLNNPLIQTAVVDRLNDLHKEGMKDLTGKEKEEFEIECQKELDAFQKMFSLVKGAVRDASCKAWFPIGHKIEMEL